MFEYWTWALTIVTRTIMSLKSQTWTLVPLLDITSNILGYYSWHLRILFLTFSDIIPDILNYYFHVTNLNSSLQNINMVIQFSNWNWSFHSWIWNRSFRFTNSKPSLGILIRIQLNRISLPVIDLQIWNRVTEYKPKSNLSRISLPVFFRKSVLLFCPVEIHFHTYDFCHEILGPWK